MDIFYGSSYGRLGVPSDSPAQASVNTSLQVFRSLVPRTGFMGIILDEKCVLQLVPQIQGTIRVELLDSSRPAFNACIADAPFAERLIRAAAEGHALVGCCVRTYCVPERRHNGAYQNLVALGRDLERAIV